MFLKLFKRDFKSLLKIYIYASIFSISINILGCLGIKLGNAVDIDVVKTILYMLSGPGIFASIVATPIFMIVITINRFYRSVFTDEAYLTFTLPIERGTIIKSKMFSSYFISLMTDALAFVNFIVTDLFFSDHSGITEGVNITFVDALSSILYFLIFLSGALFTISFILFCITLSSRMSTRGRPGITVAIIYGLFIAFMIFILLFSLHVLPSIFNILSGASEAVNIALDIIVPILINLILILLNVLMYHFIHYTIKNKLNLA